ncbi:unnamed protein product [Adineta ricciae]|uniref:F-box/LRR-repeat protein 15-like leucin rich repeat domain-containing protein n=1 Tax=Adineta ricciae TaxID=249248 RepID=A0A815ZAJ8_ADIRI|nr:unnamed protein product [Adineta ricciae]
MVARLVVLCEYAILNQFNTVFANDSSTIISLPVNLKARLFTLLSHRGLLTDDNLSFLLNCRTHTFDFRECANITDRSLLMMARFSLNSPTERNDSTKSALNPTILHFRSANVTDYGLVQFIQRYSSLRKIRLQNCSQITDESVIAIGTRCLHLLELDLTGCLQITDRGVDALRQITHLRSLALSQTHITDEALISIGQSAYNQTLNEINLKKCAEITDDGFLFLLQHCPNLSTIGFTQCPKLTERSRQNINPQTHQFSYLVWSIPV